MSDHEVDPFAPRHEPRYVAIERDLADAIAAGTLKPGFVVVEDPIARIFGTSRTPVRTALGELEKRGLLERFSGRGYLVAGATEPKRVTLTSAMFGLERDHTLQPPTMSAERIARDFEAAVAQALPYGLYRVHEQAAADHYGVSRTVVRELLSRFQDRGLVRKNRSSHWVVGPLTALDVENYFNIRQRLEPLALMTSAPKIGEKDFSEMLARTEQAISAVDGVSPTMLDRIETDLHVTLLAASDNPHLLRMIHQSQIALAVNRIFAERVGTRPFHVALVEHRIVFEFLLRNAWDAAARALEEHLNLSAARTRRRLMAISVFPEPALPDFLRRVET